MAPPPDHDCAWREHAEKMEQELAALKAQLAVLQRQVFGKKSEKMPSMASELRRSGTATADPEAAKKKRKSRAAQRNELPTREIFHPVPEEKRCCPRCGSKDLRPLGDGKKTTIFEYIPAQFERQVHVQETLVCRCGEGIVTAEPPARVIDRGSYGPGFIAHLITAKCADSMPLHRLEKALARAGIPVARSTMVELFHRAAGELAPLVRLLIERVAAAEVVHADETTVKMQAPKKTLTTFIWTFLSLLEDDPLIAYRFSKSRSGQTPQQVLGGTTGALVIDAFTGYNAVITPEGRARVGCWAHARRYFFEALATSPEAQTALDLIRDLYRIEAEATAQGIVRTPRHRTLRDEQSRKIAADLHHWLTAQESLHLPKSPLGKAIRYTLKQWVPLTRFLDDVQLPLDNNPAERSLRKVALGRKNFLFVGHEEAGENIAGLYSLIATCEANDVNPVEYLTDVLVRIQTHPQARIEELLPPQWKRLRASAAAA